MLVEAGGLVVAATSVMVKRTPTLACDQWFSDE